MLKIDLLNSTSILKRLALLQFVLFLSLVLIGFKVMANFIYIQEEGILRNIIVGVIGLIILIFIHELIHGICFKIFQPSKKVKYGYKSGMFYASMPKEIFTRRQFYTIALAPFVIISIGLLLVLLWLKLSSIIYIFAFHGAACIGDFYMVQVLYNHQQMKYIEDTDVGINLYTDKKNISSTT
ncbi:MULTISPECIES: DUF3267 domain-containing protein [Mammaliicoccus]|jgi:hypothetical protein|uniref:DUF3267 domain-containing protein n=2 Tax=Mammaliicoccus lentus TaxID=42858 RepID=A0AAP1WKH0_MAMLE|nr:MULTISPECIES: DUF3267 domain-containing protein [Mammaliicoccus]HBV04170.1 DUF3267 domain-containing protein [Staphylococcus sp.]MBF0749514.1 DUF3267 domain-containing protein [Mammaliicoccus lentus]MBF0840136.1 DUF3267 domain-containing protein [Mammaliicoccus lentus]MBU6114475.1 DUF3267 domain-containing protein [Mammaliicoccus lentus]MBW0763037.1 DUF3267 domain-containing protein [Mammaliicoccus lentus]